MSADPRRVKDAYILPDVSYYEAMELAQFGAKVWIATLRNFVGEIWANMICFCPHFYR